MPLTRYQIRNEYCLADPELYKAADKDDPEALLEGVAMAGLVGLLRQLGDLAEFAAEIFHDLHEDVMTTAARGHGLMARVKQLEAEFPSIEKVLLSQTNHSPFFSGTGVDWHPNLQMEQTLITRGDLPRFIMDSYEECRGPPQLFLLDKFDVAGAGACLKRYTDPSIFKVETISSGISTVEMQREKKIRKAKKKGSRWRNGETPEVVPSHAKLHELFLEERVDNGHSDPARRVTLKRRLLNGSTFDLKPGKSYMEKFVVTPSPERKQVCEVSVTQSPLTLTLDDSSESGFDIHEVSVLSPVKRSSQGEESTSSSPSVREVVLKPLTDEWNGKAIDKGIIKVLDPIADREIDESSCTIHKKSIEEELSVDTDGKQEVSLDGNHSDDMTSEVENYMDALTTMDSEMDTDNEHKPKGFMKVRKHREDSDSNEEQLDVQDKFSDSQSISNSSLSEGGNSFFKKGRSSFSYSDSLSNMAEKALSDGEGAAKAYASAGDYATKAYASAGDYATKDVDLPPSDHGSVNVESARTESHQLVVVNDTLTEEDIIPDPRKASCSSCITDSNPMLLPTIPVADSLVVLSEGTELDEASSGCNKLGSESLSPVKTVPCQANCLVALSDNPLQMGYGASHTVPSNCHPVDEVDHEDPYVLTDELVHVSNMSGLASEMKIDDDSVAGVFQIQTDDSAEHSVEGMIAPILQAEEQFVPSALIAVESDSSVTLPPDSSDSLVKPDGLVSVVDDVIATRDSSSESSRPMVDTSETGSIKEHRLSDMKVNALQVEIELAKLGGPCSEEKMNLEEISECPDSEDKNGFMNKVDVVGGQASPFKHQSISSDQPNPDYHVNVDDAMSEVVQAEDVAASTLATSGANDADVSNVIWPSADSVCSFSRNSTDVQESLSISEDPHQRKMHFDDVIPTECITESEVQMEVKQLRDSPIDCDSNPHNPVSEDHANLKVIENVHEPSSELSNRKLESNLNGQSLYVKASDDTICSSACYFSESGNSLEHSIEVQADQISIESVHVEPEIFLEHTLDSQPYQPDRGFLHLDDTSSISTDIHSEQIQDPHHITEERCLYTSCLRDFPSLENNATGLSTDPFDSAFPSFSLLPQASHVNPEAMPPLPPLPPMEWRLGKFQLAPPDVQSDWIDHSAGVFQPMTADQNIQFDLPSSDREILHHTNPFLSLTGDSQKSQHSTTDLVENSSLAAPLLSEMPIPDNDAKCQQDDLPPDGTHSVNSFLTHTDLVENSSLAAPLLSEMPIPDNNAKCQQDDLQPHGTHSVNSFLTSPEMPDKMPPHCFLASGEEPAQCSLNPFSLEAAAPNELVPTQGLPIHPSNQSASETGLGVKVPEQSSQNSEGEQGNSSAKPAVPLTTEDEHQCHDFITSVGQTMLPLTTLALAPTYEVGKPNGNKIPRPRNPLIDAVAAHDKSKLRKVAERVQPQLGPMAEERDSLLEQIRAKSFNLKPAAVTTRPSIQGIQGPKTNLKVAAILEKANAIRQALAGSDEDDDSDSWSDT